MPLDAVGDAQKVVAPIDETKDNVDKTSVAYLQTQVGTSLSIIRVLFAFVLHLKCPRNWIDFYKFEPPCTVSSLPGTVHVCEARINQTEHTHLTLLN